MDSNTQARHGTRADMQSMIRAQREANGPTYDEMMDAFADRIAAIVDMRLEEVRADRRVTDQDARDRSQIRLITALASLIVTVPTTAVLWHTDGPTAAAAIWVAVLLLNVIAMLRGRVQ
jgi:hypothetical protein